MKKIKFKKSTVLLYILIPILILINLIFLQETPITRNRTLLEKISTNEIPEPIFVQSRQSTGYALFNYKVIQNSSNNIIFFLFSRGKSAISRVVTAFDNGFKPLYISINQAILFSQTWSSSYNHWSERIDSWAENARRRIIAQQVYIYGPKFGGLVAAVTLGSADTLDPTTKSLFEELGLQHLIAPSGYNLSLFLLISSIFIPASFPRVMRTFLLIFTSFYLLLLTGFSPSLVRAWSMWFLGLVAWKITRRSQPAFLRLFWTVVLTFFFWPSGAATLSFQLSSMATLGIVLYAPIFLASENFFLRSELGEVQHPSVGEKWKRTIVEYAWSTLVLGLIAQAWVAPLILETFGKMQVFSPVATLAVAWVMPLVMLLGFVAVFLSPIISLAPQVFHLIFMVPRFVFETLWQLDLFFLAWLSRVLPDSSAWFSLQAGFQYVWWGSLVGFRVIWWLFRWQRQTYARRLK